MHLVDKIIEKLNLPALKYTPLKQLPTHATFPFPSPK